MSSESFRDRIAHPDLRSLYDYWLAHSGETGVMPRAALDPAAIPHLLKNLVLADVGDGGRAIRYRLVGTEIVAAHGFDFTGLSIEELASDADLQFTRQLYAMVVTRAMPIYSEGTFRWIDKKFWRSKRLHLPLSHESDGQVDQVIVGQFYEAEQGTGEVMIPALAEELATDRAAQQ